MNPSPTSHPTSSLRIIPVHQPQASCILHRHRLAIRFLHDSIRVSMTFSQIIPPSPSPSESESPLYTSVSLLLSRIFLHTEETRIERDTCTPMFIAALFIIAGTWKQPRCPSADEWIRKLWYIYTMEYYSAIKEYI